jgi:hypothetical protein
MTKIIDALREKYRTPQAALRALGLDEGLLREDDKETMSKRDKAVRAGLKEMLAQDASLAEMTEFLKTLNASGAEGAAEGFGEHEDDEDGEDEIPGAVTEPNAGLPAGAEGEEHGEEVATDEPAAAIHAILKDKCSPEELAQIGELLEKIAMPEGDEDDEDVEGEEHNEPASGEHEGEDEDSEEDTTEGEDEDEEDDMNKDLVTRPAMDEAIKVAVANAEKRAAEKANALRAAERAVEPYVGKLALDAAVDADGVYRHALTSLGVEDAATIHPSALKSLLKAMPLPGSNTQRREPRLAQDAAAAKATLDRFPNAGRLKRA